MDTVKQITAKIADTFLGGVHTKDVEDRENGGPLCDSYMTFEFRLIVSLIMVRLFR